MSTENHLRQLMRDNFQIKNVTDPFKSEFQSTLTSLLGQHDAAVEGYQDASKQSDVAVNFHWGHNHDFGEFALAGNMGDRHLEILAEFIDRFQLPLDLTGKKILDIGVWTGGTSLLFSAMGAQVVALEEVKKHANALRYMVEAFGLTNFEVRGQSLYDLDDHDQYDLIHYSGVIYHVTDPILSLRILFNALKDSGKIYSETWGSNFSAEGLDWRSIILYEGPHPQRRGASYYVPNQAVFASWLKSVGFEDIQSGAIDQKQRIKAVGTRIQHVDMLRHGLSRPNIR